MLRRPSLRHLAQLLALLAAPLLAAPAGAAPPRPTKVESGVLRAIRTGIVGPWHQHRPAPGAAPVVIELGAPATPATLALLRKAGAVLDVIDGEITFHDRWVPAVVDEAAAQAIAARPEVIRVSLRAQRGPLPLDQSAKLLRLDDARGARPALDRATGAGMVIGDIDSACDIYHPAFFRADAGYFDWIDVDGDGVLTPGVDAVDLDRDGKVGPSEVAQQIRADTFVDYLGGSVDARPPSFDPGLDWLYLDQNGNLRRDRGSVDGFDDTAPAFGEPLFVPDDVNQNGKLDAGERVIRLGTSKFRKVNIRLSYPPLGLNHKHVYERGTDLSTLPIDFSGGQLYGFADALHATGVLSIAAGDVPLPGRRWVGVAPDAELVLAFDVDAYQSVPVTATAWALKEKPDVMLYEMAPWTGLPLDGSDPLSKLIDSSTQSAGVIHTCPTGDQASAHKHAHLDLGAGATGSLVLDVPENPKAGVGPLSYVNVTVHVRGGAPDSITFAGPNGESFEVSPNLQGTLPSTGARFYTTTDMTARGTFMGDVILYESDTTAPIPTGKWTVTVAGAAASALTVDAYVADDKSSWALGAGWDDATDRSTIGVPSTADHCIAVGAHPSHVQSSAEPWFSMYYQPYDVPPGFVEAQGQVRAYSPLGPRIDGVMKPDILAPDNPWAAQQSDPGNSPPHGSYQVFGGTSGASPHVTGAAALLAQAGIKGDAARDAIRAGAIVDPVAGKVPNGDYGYGRLDVAGALGMKDPGVAPTITLSVKPDQPTTRDKVEITPTVSGGEALEITWDDDYDGTWDVGYAPAAARTLESATPVKRAFKARVRNATGRIAEAVVWVNIGEPGPVDNTGGSGGSGGTGESDSGCGCRTAPSTPALPALGAALLGLAAMARRRRR